VIAPKVERPTPRQEREAYELATARDGGVCQRCLRGGNATRDHRRNRSQGGLTVASNLQLLCGSGTTGCHGWATTHPADALRDGWAVPGWADPAAWPTRRYFRTEVGTVRAGWALLDDGGGVLEVSEFEARRRMGEVA
jgi:hypothetical protein